MNTLTFAPQLKLTVLLAFGNIKIDGFPILLAPLEDITDSPFRVICKEHGADMVYTEFISSEGLIRDAGISLGKLKFNETERPIGIQIFGHNVDSMVIAAEMAEKAQPDFIDLNYGCPVRKVVNRGGGAALLRDIPLMLRMTEAVVKKTNLPVTVKTRLGWDEKDKPIVALAEQLQDIGVQAITIHGRTRSQMYGGISDWTFIGEVKNNPRMKIPVIGNGDIKTPQDAKSHFDMYGVDAVMIGRAAIGNPWIFNQTKHFLTTGEILNQPAINERVTVCKQHFFSSIEWKGEQRTLHEMRKFYSGYFKGIDGIKPYRARLVTATSVQDVVLILDEIEREINL